MEVASQLFGFCAQDLISLREHQRMEGLKLVPLSSGQLVECGTPAILATKEEQRLLNPKDSNIVHQSLHALVEESVPLRNAARNLNIRRFDSNFLAQRLRHVLQRRVGFQRLGDQLGQFHRPRLQDFQTLAHLRRKRLLLRKRLLEIQVSHGRHRFATATLDAIQTK